MGAEVEDEENEAESKKNGRQLLFFGCKERGRQVDGPLDHSTGKGWVKDHAYGDGWVKKNAGWKWTGAQYYDAKWVKKAITRLVLVETLGGIAPPTKQFLHVFAKEAAGSNKHGPDGVRGGVGERLLLRRPPHAADLQGGGGGRRRQHQQAGAQGAYRLDQQAKEQASDERLLVLGPSGGCPRRLALQTGPSTLPVIM